jgi:hypothetical protein
VKRRAAFILLVLLLSVVAVLLLRPAAPTRQKVRLSDGNIVTVEKVTFTVGSQHDFSFDNSTLVRIRRSLPRFLRRYFPSSPGMLWNTTSNSLVLWFTMADGRSGAPLDFHDRLLVELVDEHACTASASTYGSMSAGNNPTIYIATFAQFPRRQSKFRVRLRSRGVPGTASFKDDSNKVVAEFELPNPARGPFPVWTPEPLPAARTNGELVFVLKDTGNLSEGAEWRGPQFDILRGGFPAQDWEPGEIHVAEANGNQGQRPFCTNESAWKLEVEFLRNAKAAFLPTEVFTISNLTVPPDGTAVALTNEFSVQGKQLALCSVAGGGHFLYSNTMVTLAEPLRAGQGESSQAFNSFQGATPVYQLDVSGKEPHVALTAPSLSKEERLLVRVRFPDGDARGLFHGPGSGSVWVFPLSRITNSGPFALDVIVHRVRNAEFLVKPPGK